MPLGGTVPKHLNASRIRAQGMQNTSQKTLRTLPLESIKNNNSIAREMPLQQAKPLAMSLGGTGPKHSNATSTKWLSNLLGALPLARGVGGYELHQDSIGSSGRELGRKGQVIHTGRHRWGVAGCFSVQSAVLR